MSDITRPRVGCINWSRGEEIIRDLCDGDEDWVPRAVVFVPTRDGQVKDVFFDTWTEAIKWANRYARLLRASPWADRS